MPVKVLIVDDSAIIRGLMTKALSAQPDINIAGSAANGSMAISLAKDIQPDIIILDIEMPVMDGITALPELIKVSPKSKIIMASTLTERNAAISLQALALGATDYLAKPSAKHGDEVNNFYTDLISKILTLSNISPSAPIAPPKTLASTVTAAPSVTPASAKEAFNVSRLLGAERLNPMGINALAIASSTGGPQALMTLFGKLNGHLLRVPIFITQHMPPTFTTILAEHLTKISGRPCTEAKNGMQVAPGHIYLAPGDYHMLASKDAASGQVTLRINQDPQENFCRPAADPMLRSLSPIYGSHLALLVLTGMGQDGMEGAKYVVKAGGSVIAQDEASCTVYGMPRAVVENNLCKAVLPLNDIGGFLIQQIDGVR